MTESLTATAESREIRVFLSSTFRDFTEERKLLATQVFPALNERARDRGVELIEVDLRWGITQEEAEVGHALEICLQEIENCKPYFIGMLGDSYGTITPSQRQILQESPELISRRKWLDGRIGEASYTEIEILHSIELLQKQEMKGQALFYFRKSAYSKLKASMGEEGWISTDPDDRRRLEELKSKIRRSGHYLVEDLDDPQAIARQIEKDLWTLIERKFPEGNSPNEAERENRKHKAYGDDRRKLYLGGNKLLDKLEKAIEDEQGLILITGESGFGKSSLVANWQKLHGKSTPADIVFCHHLGCGNEASDSLNVVKRCVLFSQSLLEKHGIVTSMDGDTLPNDWWNLVALLNQNLSNLSHICAVRNHRFIWILDSLDRLANESQSSLPWIPSTLPPNIHIVVAALPCKALSVLLERKYRRIRIHELNLEEKQGVIDLHLKKYSRSLDKKLRERIVDHYLAHSPLFLRLLLEELRKTAAFDCLEIELDKFLECETVPEVYEKILIRLENDFSAHSVNLFLVAIWASRKGLNETDLLEITGIPPLKLFGICLSLGDSLINSAGRLIFAHDYVRSAVEHRYLSTNEDQQVAHELIFNWISTRPVWDKRKVEELPWQAMKAGKTDVIKSLFHDTDLLISTIDSWGPQGVYILLTSAFPTTFYEVAGVITEKSLGYLKLHNLSDNPEFSRAADAVSDFLEFSGLHDNNYLYLRRIAFRCSGNGVPMHNNRREQAFKRLMDAYCWTGNYRSYRHAANIIYRRKCKSYGKDSAAAMLALIDLVKAHYLCYEYTVVTDLITKCFRAAKQALGENHPSFLLLVYIYGRMCSELGDTPLAVGLLCYATEGFYACLGAGHWQTVSALHQYGIAFSGRLHAWEHFSNVTLKTCLKLLRKTYRHDHPFICKIRNGDSIDRNKLCRGQQNPISTLLSFCFLPGRGMIGAIVKRYNIYVSFKAPPAAWVLLEAYSQEAVDAAEKGDSKKAFALLYRKLHWAIHRLSTEKPTTPSASLEALGLKILTRLCHISGQGYIANDVETPLLSRSHKAAFNLINIFGNLTPSGLSCHSADLRSVLEHLSCDFYMNPGDPRCDTLIGVYRNLESDSFRSWYYIDHAHSEAYQPFLLFDTDANIDVATRGLYELCGFLLNFRLFKLDPDDFLIGQALILCALVKERACKHDASTQLLRQLLIHRLRHSTDLQWSIDAAKREFLRTFRWPSSWSNDECASEVVDLKTYIPKVWRFRHLYGFERNQSHQ